MHVAMIWRGLARIPKLLITKQVFSYFSMHWIWSMWFKMAMSWIWSMWFKMAMSWYYLLLTKSSSSWESPSSSAVIFSTIQPVSVIELTVQIWGRITANYLHKSGQKFVLFQTSILVSRLSKYYTERFRLEAVTVCILSKKDSHSAAGMCTALWHLILGRHILRWQVTFGNDWYHSAWEAVLRLSDDCAFIYQFDCVKRWLWEWTVQAWFEVCDSMHR